MNRMKRLRRVVAGTALLVALGWMTPAEAVTMPTVGTSGGNKDVSVSMTIGTSGGNKTVTEGWVGTSGGNKQFLSSDSGSMYALLVANSLTTNLKVCVDAADSASYSGSGQNWTDRSANASSFYRGTTSGSDATDPTFNGTAGAQTSSEYWSFDGGDYFVNQNAVQTWMSNMHKDNAAWSMYCVYYYNASGGAFPMLGTSNGSGTGIEVGIQAAKGGDDIFVQVTNAGSSVYSVQKASPPSATGWTSLGFSMNEASANSAIRHEKGTNTTGLASTYTSPSASAADHTMHIGSRQNGTFIVSANHRLAIMCIWEGTALTSTDFTTIHNAIKARYGW